MSKIGQFQSADKVLVEWANREISESHLHIADFVERLTKTYLAMVPEESRSAPIKDVPRDGAIDDFYRIKTSNTKNISRWLSGENRIPWDVFDAWIAALTGKYRDGCMISIMARFGVMPVEIPGTTPAEATGDAWRRLTKAHKELAEVGEAMVNGKSAETVRQEAFEAMTAAAALWVQADEMARRQQDAA